MARNLPRGDQRVNGARNAISARGGARGCDMNPAVHFGAWHPIADAAAAAPDRPGVLQARAEGIMDYETGRSAMVLYACTNTDESLRDFLMGRGARDVRRAVAAGSRWIRFAETADPPLELRRLLDGFVERFGAPPIANAGGSRKARIDD
jgi:hypothetical protein